MASVSHNHSFLSDSVLCQKYGSKQNNVMFKLTQSLYISACGEGSTCISHFRTGIYRISQLSLGRRYQDLPQGEMREKCMDKLAKSFFKLVHSRSEAGMYMSVERHSSLQQNIVHVHTEFSKK